MIGSSGATGLESDSFHFGTILNSKVMYGPEPKDHWRTAWERDGYGFQSLTRGRRYRVVKSFRDYDGDEHLPGEAWFYLGHDFLPYEDGLSLFVSLDGDQEWLIRMRWTAQDQAPIIDAINDYVAPDES